jgi:hypothetical protein
MGHSQLIPHHHVSPCVKTSVHLNLPSHGQGEKLVFKSEQNRFYFVCTTSLRHVVYDENPTTDLPYQTSKTTQPSK